MNTLKIGKYQHSKTQNFYKVIGTVKHSETLEDLVLYECLYENPLSKVWVRPLHMFLGDVTINGKVVPRFRYVGEN